MVDAESKGPRVDVGAIFGLLWIGWGLGTPYCLFVSAMTGAAFFGETPTDAERSEAQLYLAGGLVCALVLPIIGMLIAGRCRRRGSVWAFGIALAISACGLAYVTSLMTL
jgi:hypothetical protein